MTSSSIQSLDEPLETHNLTTQPKSARAENQTLAGQLGTDPMTTTVAAAVSGGVAGAAIGRLVAGRVGATIGAMVGGIAGAAISHDDSSTTTPAVATEPPPHQPSQPIQDVSRSHGFSTEQTYELSAEMHYQIGVALGRQGKLDKAIEEFQEALDLAPDSAETHYNLGIALSKQGDVDQGLEYLQQARELCLVHGNPKGAKLIKRAIKKIDRTSISR